MSWALLIVAVIALLSASLRQALACEGHHQPHRIPYKLRHWWTCRLLRLPTWNVRLGSWSKAFAASYGVCGRCGTPWRFVQPRVVDYESGSGQFALCVKCWDEATQGERLLAHQAVTLNWDEYALVWPAIREAVAREHEQAGESSDV